MQATKPIAQTTRRSAISNVHGSLDDLPWGIATFENRRKNERNFHITECQAESLI